MSKRHPAPEQLSLAEELQPTLPRQHGRGQRRHTDAHEHHRPRTIWAHEGNLPAGATSTYHPVMRRDPEWVAKNLDAADRGVILLTLGAADSLAHLLDDQFVFEARTMVDLEDGTCVPLQEKRRRGLALARRSLAEVEDLHIPLCPSIKATLTSHQTSQWLLAELAYALKGELMPAIQQVERLQELLRLQEAQKIANAIAGR